MRGDDSYKLKWTNKMALNYNFKIKKSLKARLVCLYRENTPEFIMQKLRARVRLFEYEEIQV